MSRKTLRALILNEQNVISAVRNTIKTTNNYNLTDWFDTQNFNPVFNAARNSIIVFPVNSLGVELPLMILFPTHTLADILLLFNDAQIFHDSSIFTAAESEKIPLEVYYEAALMELPDEHRSKLLVWKTIMAKTDKKMLAGRACIWRNLWTYRFAVCYSYHPAVFQSIISYKGPMGVFLQQAQANVQITCGPLAMTEIYDTIICTTWTIDISKHSRFLKLWHLIVQESACAYLNRSIVKTSTNSVQKNLDASNIKICSRSPHIMHNADKLLCVLLLIFNVPYQTKMKQILVDEPYPGFLANIKALYPQLFMSI